MIVMIRLITDRKTATIPASPIRMHAVTYGIGFPANQYCEVLPWNVNNMTW